MRRTVDVWRFALDLPDSALGLLVDTLSDSERARAEAIRDARALRRTLAARGRLRCTLAGYLGVEPRSVELTYGPHGKPALVGEGGPRGLRFSASRSGNVGVIAVARGREVGIDVERIDARRALGPIADQLFASDESAELRALPDDRRIRRFFELWTRKEAYGKALGTGLTVPLAGLRAPSGWLVCDLALGASVAGALCVRGRGLRVRMVE